MRIKLNTKISMILCLFLTLTSCGSKSNSGTPNPGPSSADSSTTISNFQLCDNNQICSDIISTPTSPINVIMPTQSSGDLKAVLTIPSGANIFINGTPIIPTQTFNDYYSKGQVYSVTAADGKTTANYSLNVTKDTPSNPCPDPNPAQFNLNYDCSTGADYQLDFTNVSNKGVQNVIVNNYNNSKVLYNGVPSVFIDKGTHSNVCGSLTNMLYYVKYSCGDKGDSKNIAFPVTVTNKPTPPPSKGYWPDATAVSDSSPLPDTLPTGESLLRVINKCSYPIVIRNMGTNISVPAPGDKNNSNNALDYHIQIGINGHKGGRVFASAGCDSNNANCLIGPKNNGIGAKADTLFESVWASDKDFPIVQPDISAVNGFTFPMKMTFTYKNQPQLFDCGKLSYDFCPETFKSAFTGITYNERIIASDGTIVACNSPMNVAAAGTEDFTRYACPNDDVKGCRDNYKMQIGADPRPATADSPEYVQRLHQFGQYAGKMDTSCKLYSFSYDDSFGLPSGDKDKPIVVTFCPEPGSSPKLPSH